MKKIISILVFSLTLLMSENILAQDNFNKTNKKGRRQGKWLDYHSNGQIKYTGQFKNNEPIGDFMYYSEDGTLIAKNNYQKNSDVVENEAYSPKGNVVAKGNYVNKKKQGRWEYYSENDGSIILVENYDNGLLVGKSITYLPGTQLVIEETEYVNGVKHGLYSRCYDNGVPMIEATYSGDKLNGNYVHYHSNGMVKEEGVFKDGSKIGEWKIYDIEGNLVSTDNYLDFNPDFSDIKEDF